MSQNNKIISILLVGAIVGVFVSEYMYDRDFDGIPNDEDAFPSNSKEWKDNWVDGQEYSSILSPTLEEITSLLEFNDVNDDGTDCTFYLEDLP